MLIPDYCAKLNCVFKFCFRNPPPVPLLIPTPPSISTREYLHIEAEKTKIVITEVYLVPMTSYVHQHTIYHKEKHFLNDDMMISFYGT